MTASADQRWALPDGHRTAERRSLAMHRAIADRLIAVRGPGTRDATGWCLEPHDVVAAKLAAGRAHDVEFAREALRAGIVDEPTLRARIEALPLDVGRLGHARELLCLAASPRR